MFRIPQDFDELIRDYSDVLLDAGVPKKDLLLVASRLVRERDVLKHRSPLPDTVTGPQLLAYLGIPFSTWGSFVDRCQPKSQRRDKQSKAKEHPYSHLCPQPIEGGAARGGPYLMEDVQKVFEHRRQIFSKFKTPEEAEEAARNPNPRPSRGKNPPKVHVFTESVVPMKVTFGEHLYREAQAMLNIPDYDRQFFLPENLPQDHDELHAKYERLVFNIVFRKIKFGIRVEDAVNDVWERITKTGVLRMFIQKGADRLPSVMTASEVKDYLGITDHQWIMMHVYHDEIPVPVSGSYKDPDAQYKTDDIRKLDESGYFKRRLCQRRLPPASVTDGQLAGYIRRTTHNTLANLFRTRTRRFNREHTLGNVVLTEAGDTHRFRHSVVDDPVSWEDTLVSKDPTVEDLCVAHLTALDEDHDAVTYQEAVVRQAKAERVETKNALSGRLASALGIQAGSEEYHEAVRDILKQVSEQGIDLSSLSPERALDMVATMMTVKVATG